ncbi:hypothetical protein HJC23_004703 [Cyclotella cryptica]|uniref:Nickel/cobalt efflux system n=1 Tax=Cyclotella cryptica TaxID=29204 RepID=A0ABD3PSG7_9STRA|eukprot:CCRYP_012026-RA/>CCRYP_012026-RA protein AED:0.05 eAED:0.05 QI:0/-1/0/1/-1/1/1/0/409
MSVARLISTGVIMGIVHVLTGPDHLAALMTLSGTDVRCGNNVYHALSESQKCEAFFLGVRWGIGHSMGLILTGGVLIFLQERTSRYWLGTDNWIATLSEGFVGIFMLIVGAYGMMKALRNKEHIDSPLLWNERGNAVVQIGKFSNHVGTQSKDSNLDVDDSHNEPSRSQRERDCFSVDEDNRKRSVHDVQEKNLRSAGDGASKIPQSLSENIIAHLSDNYSSCSTRQYYGSMMHDLHRLHVEDCNDSTICTKPELFLSVSNCPANESPIEKPRNAHPFYAPSFRSSGLSKCFSCTPAALALLSGIVHGVAGPGGVLGVIPAVQLHDTKLAIIYLGTFCVTSSLVMGGFAAFYRIICECLVQRASCERDDANYSLSRVFFVEFGSACLSIVVGIVWLALLGSGKLDDVFP